MRVLRGPATVMEEQSSYMPLKPDLRAGFGKVKKASIPEPGDLHGVAFSDGVSGERR